MFKILCIITLILVTRATGKSLRKHHRCFSIENVLIDRNNWSINNDEQLHLSNSVSDLLCTCNGTISDENSNDQSYYSSCYCSNNNIHQYPIGEDTEVSTQEPAPTMILNRVVPHLRCYCFLQKDTQTTTESINKQILSCVCMEYNITQCTTVTQMKEMPKDQYINIVTLLTSPFITFMEDSDSEIPVEKRDEKENNYIPLLKHTEERNQMIDTLNNKPKEEIIKQLLVPDPEPAIVEPIDLFSPDERYYVENDLLRKLLRTERIDTTNEFNYNAYLAEHMNWDDLTEGRYDETFDKSPFYHPSITTSDLRKISIESTDRKNKDEVIKKLLKPNLTTSAPTTTTPKPISAKDKIIEILLTGTDIKEAEELTKDLGT